MKSHEISLRIGKWCSLQGDVPLVRLAAEIWLEKVTNNPSQLLDVKTIHSKVFNFLPGTTASFAHFNDLISENNVWKSLSKKTLPPWQMLFSPPHTPIASSHSVHLKSRRPLHLKVFLPSFLTFVVASHSITYSNPEKKRRKLKTHYRKVEFYINHEKMIRFSIFLGGYIYPTIQEVQWPTANCTFIHFLHHLASGLAPKTRRLENPTIPTSWLLDLLVSQFFWSSFWDLANLANLANLVLVSPRIQKSAETTRIPPALVLLQAAPRGARRVQRQWQIHPTWVSGGVEWWP